MDGLLLFMPTKKSHFAKLEDLLKSFMQKLVENFSKEMPAVQDRVAVYGNTIFIKDRRVCVKPLRSRLEAIQKLKPPTTIKGCRSLPER